MIRSPLPLLWFLLAFTSTLAAGPRDAQWAAVEEAISQGLPQTAVERLQPIAEGAIAEQAYAEAVKAIARKIALQTEIQGGLPEEAVIRLQAELESAPDAMRPAMQAILGHWYWNYFQQNRWRFLQRAQTGAEPGPDFQTWDLKRILQEIDRHFSAALEDEVTLKATPIFDYDELLEKGTVPDAYRPSLYDFLAYEALAFYQAGEQGAVQAEDAFELEADGPIFEDAQSFLDWLPAARRDADPKLKAIRLYQSLLRFHRHDADPSAYYDANLARLEFGRNFAVGETAGERYQAALRRFIEATAAHEISTRVRAALAESLLADDQPPAARAEAQRGLDAFPDSVGGAQCYNLIQRIEAKSAALATESVWNAPWPTLDVTYRNIKKVYFRAVPVDFFAHHRVNEHALQQEHWEMLLALEASLEWEASLPPTSDFRERQEKLPAPSSLSPGYYYILASHQPHFENEDNQLSIARVWVSDLALVFQQRWEGMSSGLVVDSKSGRPIEGAAVKVWHWEEWERDERVATYTTDENGHFTLNVEHDDDSLLVHVQHLDQEIANTRYVASGALRDLARPYEQTIFFTDRALYRPGQTIHYKGISLRYSDEESDYAVLKRQSVPVSFRDANGQEIAKATHLTNDFGSFSGSFTAPRDRALGAMSIEARLDPRGYVRFNVEEYKRPKFQVTLEAPAEAPKLGEIVELQGQAAAYTGAPIDGAKVGWRVERSVRVPSWNWWWQPPADKAIAHGTATSDIDGSVSIAFEATPDRSASPDAAPVFIYTVYADVTDGSGETRSAEVGVRVGYTAMHASLVVDEWQTPHQPVALRLSTTSLDGYSQAAQGRLAIYRLRQPKQPARAPLRDPSLRWLRSSDEPEAHPSIPESWKNGRRVAWRKFSIGASGSAELDVSLPVGIYRAVLETKDRFGATVTARKTLQVVDPESETYAVNVPNHFSAPKWTAEPGNTFTALWGTGYPSGQAFVEIECKGETLQRYWTEPERTQEMITLPVTDAMRGGVTVRVTYVRENRIYLNERVLDVPWTNKQLSVKWERFRSKLSPGQKETWTAVVSGSEAEKVVAEVVAGLYDASLDQFRPHRWIEGFNVFRAEYSEVASLFENRPLSFHQFRDSWTSPARDADWTYRYFPNGFFPQDQHSSEVFELSPFEVDDRQGYRAASTLSGSRLLSSLQEAPAAPSAPDLDQVSARRNLDETAFFFPHLAADEDGVVKIQFTVPEALTEWRFFGFAHDAELRSGFLADRAVTAKDLMVQPNPPRFLREGDALEFTVKVTNLGEQPQRGQLRLSFADALSLQSVDRALGNDAPERPFSVPAKQSRSYAWRLDVPDGMGPLTYKAVGSAGELSDGEEGVLPVLSRRILVTESLPLPLREVGSRQFTFKKLLDSANSDTLQHQSLTLQMVSQPAWYAVMALPYLMEYPHECSEQLFNRYYANQVARHIVRSDPKIRRVFERWRGTDTLDSPLEQNQELKAVLLEETPWMRQAQSETQARQNVGILFDDNRLEQEMSQALRKLAERQYSDGLWPWFPGGSGSDYITLYIATGFGRLRHLGVATDVGPALKAFSALDAWAYRRYLDIQEQYSNLDDYVPSPLIALYLYGRSFFPELAVSAEHEPAMDFFLAQAEARWVQVRSRQSQAHLAIALQRFERRGTPLGIMKSLKERSVSDDELGMFWRDQERSWWWYRAPIETQAMMIEAFDEVAQDAQAVEDCKVWLLKQKQTQDWKTTKATADAVYALLLRGETLLASDALVEVSLGGQTIQPENVEAGTGFYEKRFVRDAVKPSFGRVETRKSDSGVSWGSVHWQYLETVEKVTPHEATPLQLKKTLFVKETTAVGQVLQPVEGPISVGDELVVRIELRSDRDMEYLHLKDQRGSGTEPVAVLSRYRYQDGLGYYESARDTASHFFISYLPKGTYVFEYSTRVQHRGAYQSGIAEIQCMYAPEFNSHSESFELEVQ